MTTLARLFLMLFCLQPLASKAIDAKGDSLKASVHAPLLLNHNSLEIERRRHAERENILCIAAQKNDMNAMGELANTYAIGGDLFRAKYWFQKLADAGDRRSQIRLGQISNQRIIRTQRQSNLKIKILGQVTAFDGASEQETDQLAHALIKIPGYPDSTAWIFRREGQSVLGFFTVSSQPACDSSELDVPSFSVYELDLSSPDSVPQRIMECLDHHQSCLAGHAEMQVIPSRAKNEQWLAIRYIEKYGEVLHLYHLESHVNGEALSVDWNAWGQYKGSEYLSDECMLIASGRGEIEIFHFPDMDTHGCNGTIAKQVYRLDSLGRLEFVGTESIGLKELEIGVKQAIEKDGISSIFGQMNFQTYFNHFIESASKEGGRPAGEQEAVDDNPLHKLACMTGENWGNEPVAWKAGLKGRGILP